MKKISFLNLVALTAFFVAPLSVAHADTVPGWYLGAGVVGHQPVAEKAKVAGVDNPVGYDFGWGLLGDLGYAWQNGLRVEGELSFMRSNVNKVNEITEDSGRFNDFLGMTNLYYDFQTGTRWTPYIGAGAGFDAVDADHIGTLTNGGALNDSQFEFAYQGIAGVAYELNDHLALTADYRYIASSEATFKTTVGGTGKIDNASHNIVLTLRYALHAPAAPVAEMVEPQAPVVAAKAPTPAPPVAAVPQSYMVFFDFDKSVLTPEAKSILASAAADFKKDGFVRVVVTGHTDTVGTTAYNQKLSERRAASVKEELVRLGVDVRTIETIGVGKNGLLVPTADQIREAQNRRAEIVFNKEVALNNK